MVEGLGIFKHSRHFCNFRGVPAIDVLIKIIRSKKHQPHIGYIAYVPIVQRLIKNTGNTKDSGHIFYIAHIPVVDIAIKFSAQDKHGIHTCNCRKVWDIGCIIYHIFTTRKAILHTLPNLGSPLVDGKQFEGVAIRFFVSWCWKCSNNTNRVDAWNKVGMGNFTGHIVVKLVIAPINRIIIG